MVQGDGYYGSRSQGAAPDESLHGYDLLARWRHGAASGATLQLQAYYDHSARKIENDGGRFALDTFDVEGQHSRSEEHTSELQSLMRTSYAVFCLKKKTTNQDKH